MNFHLVDSVKGGCGKTSLALWKAIQLENDKEKNKKVCYFDFDLLGTSLEKLLNFSHNNTILYLNDLFINSRNDIRKRKTITKCYYDKNGKLFDESKYRFNNPIGSFSILFSSPCQESKNLFRVNTSNSGKYIDYDFFANKITELIQLLDEGEYTDIVIDMPPNSDPYTDSVFRILLDIKNNYNINLMMVSSYDRSHIEANTEWCVDLLQRNSRWKPFDSIECFFNDVRKNINDVCDAGAFTPSELISQPCNRIKKIYQKELSIFNISYSNEISNNSIYCQDYMIINLSINKINLNEDR